ncbi:MAG: hypothetical protein FWD04_07030, partial [Conexibacteraceae bacterium]|nr:hypothetical protein [Conexibacteraceae bacterium]
PHLPAAERSRLASALGSGGVPGGHAPPVIVNAVQHAFVSALSTGLVVCAIVTLVGAALTLVLIEGKERVLQPAEPVRT